MNKFLKIHKGKEKEENLTRERERENKKTEINTLVHVHLYEYLLLLLWRLLLVATVSTGSIITTLLGRDSLVGFGDGVSIRIRGSADAIRGLNSVGLRDL